MYSIQSFRANGERVEAVNESVGFYGLFCDGRLVDLFTTWEAVSLAIQIIRADEETIEFEIAA